MTRDEALNLIHTEIDNANLVKHFLATEAIMISLAGRLGGDSDIWGLAGLVHDIDLGRTNGDMEVHGLVGAEILEEQGVDSQIVGAVLAHAEKKPCETALEKALYAVDPLTGLIVASALIHPDKKLASIDAEFVMNRYHEKAFARGARREAITNCAQIGIELEEFVDIGLKSMQAIAVDLGL